MSSGAIQLESLPRRMRWLDHFARVNQELWITFTLFVLAAILNFLVTEQRMVLGLYALPALFSAYVYGRRHAVLTALASAWLVVLVTYFNPPIFAQRHVFEALDDKWVDILMWASILLITAYAMGTLHEHREKNLRELRDTYYGVLLILQQLISNDKYTHHHSYRVSLYATAIARRMALPANTIEDIRAAALLHDVGKLQTSRELLYKAASLSKEEYEDIRKHVDKGVALLEPVGGSMRRVLPIILAHHDRFDGTGYHATAGERIPLEARILAVADVYDAATSDRPYRKAISPLEAKGLIVSRSGTDFDPQVVEGFERTFEARELEIPEAVL